MTSPISSPDAQLPQPSSLKQPSHHHDLRRELQTALHQCRAGTLALFDGLDRQTFCCQADADFSPVGWHLGHIGLIEAYWILDRCAGQPFAFPSGYEQLFAADGLPKDQRVQLPSFETLCNVLAQVRSRVFDYLAIAPLEQQARLWHWLLQHESQHAETIAIILALQGIRPSASSSRMDSTNVNTQAASRASESFASGDFAADSFAAGNFEAGNFEAGNFASEHSGSDPAAAMVYVPAGSFDMGQETDRAAVDNERPRHRVELGDYWIDRYPVTNGQYRQFIQADGYENSQWWTEAGWHWRLQHKITQPLYWSADGAWDQHPVCGVSWYEAAAYARFCGKRLPTEAEWEKAASWNPATARSQLYPWGDPALTDTNCDRAKYANHFHQVGWTTPVNAYGANQSPLGCRDMLGNVWEWTDSWFQGYDGFQPYPYVGYSQVFFDGQHRVLRGGSWATRPWALRNSFRNWYYPTMRQLFAGFRCATSATDDPAAS